MIKNIVLDFDKDPEKVIDEDLYSYSGRKNIEKVLSVEAIVNTTKLSLSALGDFFINLQKLRLDNSTITTVRDIGCTFKNLRYLSLNNCGITSLNGISTLSQNIEELYLQKNLIKDVSDLMGMEKLRILDLTDNQITDAANLQFLSCCSNLKTLYFGGNPAINNSNFYEDLQKYASQLNVILKPRQEKKENNYQKNISSTNVAVDQNITKNLPKEKTNEKEKEKEKNKTKNDPKHNDNNSQNQNSTKNTNSRPLNKEKSDTSKDTSNIEKEKKSKMLDTEVIHKKDNILNNEHKLSNQNEEKSNTSNNKNSNKVSAKNEQPNANEIKDKRIIKKRTNEEKKEDSIAININKKDDDANNDKKNQRKDISNQNELKSKENSDIDIQKSNKNKQKMDIIDLIYNNKAKITKKDNKSDTKNETKNSSLDLANNNNSKIKPDTKNEISNSDVIKNDKNEQNEAPRTSEITEFELVKTRHKKRKRHHSVNKNSKEEKQIDKAQDFEQKNESSKEYLHNKRKMEQMELNQINKAETKTEKQDHNADSTKPQSRTNKDNIIFININNEKARKKIDNNTGKEIKIPTETKNSSRININSKNIEKLESSKIESNSKPNEESKEGKTNVDDLEASSSKLKSNTNIIISKESKSVKENELKKKMSSNSYIDEIKANSSNHDKHESDKINKSEQERKSQKRNSINCPDSELLEILRKPGTESSKKKKYSDEHKSGHLSSQKDQQVSKTNSKLQQQQNLFKPSPPSSPPQLSHHDDTDKQNNSTRHPLIIGPTKIKNQTDPYSRKGKNDLHSTKNGTENETENFTSKGHQKSSEKLRSSAKQVEEMYTHEEKSFFDPSKQKQDQIRVKASRTPSELAYNKRSSQKKVDNSSFDNFLFHNNNNITADFSLYKPKSNKIDTFDFTGDFDLILDKKTENTNSSRRQKSKNGLIDENSHNKAKKDIEVKRIKRPPSELSDSSHQKVESRDFDEKNSSHQKSTLPPIDQSLYPNSSRGKKSSQPESLLVDDNSDDGATTSKRPGSKLSSRLATATPTTITSSNGATPKYLMPSPRSKIITKPL